MCLSFVYPQDSSSKASDRSGRVVRMAARPNSSGPESSAGSQAELPPVHGLNKMGVLPEEWTLPHEWKIEKRELFNVSTREVRFCRRLD